MSDYSKLEKCLDYQFKNKNLIIEALTHKSYKKPYNNERLEFLGDAVLNLIVGEYLFLKFPKSNEGELSKIRASLVNETGFTRLANEIKLGDFIYISTAEERNKGRTKASILSDAFEAIMGAIYLESGLEILKPIILNLLEKSYDKINLDVLFSDYKTALQEITQAQFASIPEYKIEEFLYYVNARYPLQEKVLSRQFGTIMIDLESYAKDYLNELNQNKNQ